MNTTTYATTELMLAQQQASADYEKDRQIIKEHLDRKFMDALKRMFNYDMPCISYYRNEDGTVSSGQDFRMVMLNGAVKDGQREVIATLEYILNH